MSFRILITNDDGIDAPGIIALTNAVKDLGEIIVVAPENQKSAVSHSLTISRPLRFWKHGNDPTVSKYAVNGTPTDCVKLALSTILDKKPDLVLSGINHGQNTSVNILYSGTLAAATEGMLAGIPSIAFSHSSFDYKTDFSSAGEIAKQISQKILTTGLPNGTLLNVNIPDRYLKELSGINITRTSDSYWDDCYEKRTDPFGRDYYWFAGKYVSNNLGNNTDEYALNHGFVSITPLHFKMTNDLFIDELTNYFK